MKVRLILVDDHRILIEGMSLLLTNNYEIAGIFSEPQLALQFIRQDRADVLITDYEMPGMNGIQLFQAARNEQPLLKGILLSMHDEAIVVKQAMKAGFHGFLLKNVSKQELNTALEKIFLGHTYVSAELTQKLLQPYPTTILSERERQVLRFIIKEYSNKQIADALFLSERTVETYRKNLFQKANTNNVVGLIKYAYANNLVE